MAIVSFIGNSYEKEILAQIKLDEAAKIAKYIFVFLGSLVAISSIALFIRFFSRRVKKVVMSGRPEYAEQLDKQLNSGLFDRITLFIIFVILLGALYTFYEISIGAF